MGRKRILALVLAAVGVAVAGCGVPTDEEARDLPEADVPFDLLAAEAPTTTTSTIPSVPADVTVFMVGRDRRLVPVTRTVASPVTVEKVVVELTKGPTDSERRRGIRTAVTRETIILSAPVADLIADIDLDGFIGTAGTEQLMALAQIVFSATELEGVNGVRFTVKGNAANVLTELGSTSQPVGRAAYPSLAPL